MEEGEEEEGEENWDISGEEGEESGARIILSQDEIGF